MLACSHTPNLAGRIVTPTAGTALAAQQHMPTVQGHQGANAEDRLPLLAPCLLQCHLSGTFKHGRQTCNKQTHAGR